MCPTTGFLQLLIVAMLLFAAFQIMRTYKTAKINFQTLSGLLAVPQIKRGFASIRLEGSYRGRKTVLNYWLLGGDGVYQVEFYIEPISDLRKQGFFLLTYPKPTNNTFLRGKRLFYADNIFRSRNDALYAVQDFTDILGILSEAMDKIEKENRKR